MQISPNINTNYKVQNTPVSFSGDVEDIKKAELEGINLDKTPKKDEVVFSTKAGGPSEAEKKQIIYKSQTNAAGWSIIGGPISSLYYGLRSDETIAKKFDLDPKKDAKLINDVRKQQVIATLPGVVGFGILGWLGFKVFGKPQPEA